MDTTSTSSRSSLARGRLSLRLAGGLLALLGMVVAFRLTWLAHRHALAVRHIQTFKAEFQFVDTWTSATLKQIFPERIAEAVPEYFGRVQSLTLLDDRFDCADVPILRELPELRTLVLETEKGDALVCTIAEQLPSLECLCVIDIGKSVTDRSCRCIAEELPGLASLSLETAAITDEGIVALSSLPLQLLSVSGCRVGDRGMIAVMRAAAQLESICVRDTEVSDATVAEAVKLKQLRVLDLAGCRQVTDGSIAALENVVGRVDVSVRRTSISRRGRKRLGLEL